VRVTTSDRQKSVILKRKLKLQPSALSDSCINIS